MGFRSEGKIADWYSEESETPMDRWYGTYQVEEPMATVIDESYRALRIPDDQIYRMNLEVQSGRKAHSQAIRNLKYQDKWNEILGSSY